MTNQPPRPDRRRVLAGLAASAGAGVLAACGDSHGLSSALTSAPVGNGSSADMTPAPAAPAVTLPAPADSGIDHIVLVMMENRTFDHMLGWVPGADGVQAGLSFKAVDGKTVSSFPLAADSAYGFQGCSWADPDHSYGGGRTHYNGGKLDGWLLTADTNKNPNDKFPIGYYREEDLPFYKGMAANWTICDRYFSGILSATYPNRVYMHAGATDRLTNSSTTSTLPTIWDRLAAKSVSGTYFFNDAPLLALWGQKYGDISKPFSTFKQLATLGQLPSVSYIDPFFLGESPNGVSKDDHPNADIRNGQAFLNEVYESVRNSPNWDRTLLIINYDEWGGFYDHVAPPLGPVSAAESTLGNDGRLGFRVPFMMAGPRVKKGVNKMQFDPQSVLNFITWRFGLDAVGTRANWSLNLAYALDFANPPRTDKPAFNVPVGPFGVDCSSGAPVPGVPAATPGFSTPLNALDASTARAVKVAASSHPAESHFAEWLILKRMGEQYGMAG